jgi:DNA-binding PadR family transcriptional regulator
MDFFTSSTHRRSFGLKYWVLGMLYRQDMSGAMIIDTMSQKSFGMWRPSPGSIYPLLRDMENRGEIKMKKTVVGQKIYGITDKGKRSLNSFDIPFFGRFWESDGSSVSSTIDSMEADLDYLSDKSEELKKDKEAVKRLNKIKDDLSRLAK